VRTPNRARITHALDALRLYGPEVDEALGVREPTVDLWESGDLIPTAAQIKRLALVTQYAEEFFYKADGLVPRNLFIPVCRLIKRNRSK